MNSCDMAILNAYVDDELDASSRQRVETHVRGCALCARELHALQELSRSMAEYPFADLDPHELARVHKAIKSDDVDPVWRLGGVLSAMAASVLIVSGVWLTQIPRLSTQTVRSAAPPQNWERIAVNLRVDPFQVNQQPTQFADADLAELMLEGLRGNER